MTNNIKHLKAIFDDYFKLQIDSFKAQIELKKSLINSSKIYINESFVDSTNAMITIIESNKKILDELTKAQIETNEITSVKKETIDSIKSILE